MGCKKEFRYFMVQKFSRSDIPAVITLTVVKD